VLGKSLGGLRNISSCTYEYEPCRSLINSLGDAHRDLEWPNRPEQLNSTRPLLEMSYFFSTPVDIDIVLEDTDDRATIDVKLDKNRREKAPLYMDGESVKGAVTIRPKDGKKLEHTGIKVQFIGTIGEFY